MPKAAAVTDEQMDRAGLSDEERAAFEDDEDTGEDVVAEAEEDTDDDSDGGAAAQATDDPAKATPQASEETEPDGSAADHSAKDESADDDDEEPDTSAEAHDDLVDSFRAQLAARGIPDDLDAQMKANNDAIDALDKQLEEGEIDYAAHAKENRRLVAQMAELTALQREAEFVTANNELQAEQHWTWEVERFTEEHEQFKNPVMWGALRGALEDLYADEENAGKSYRWFLKTAGNAVNEAFGTPRRAAAQPADDGESDVTKAEDLESAVEKAAPVTAPPKTLAGVPEAAAQPTSKDPFAKLDELEGMELEAALSKMSQTDQKRYLDSRNY